METHISRPLNNILLYNSFIMAKNNIVPIFDRLVSVYQSAFDMEPQEMKLREFLALGERHKEQILRLRSCTDKAERQRYKKHLPMMTTSGVFRGRRLAENLAAHNGLICIDIDKDDNTDVPDFDHLKENVLCHIKQLAYAARSVGGKGFFVIIPLKYPDLHKRQFEHLQLKFAELGITIDAACKDVSRLRCVSYDEEPYINENAEQYTGVKDMVKPITTSRRFLRSSFADDTDERVYQACKEIELRRIDMTESYEDWIAIGFSLATLGEGGRDYFHIVSRQSPKYKARETDQKFTSFLRSGSNGCSIGTFFYFCHQFGVI